jgi:hypothetical protein
VGFGATEAGADAAGGATAIDGIRCIGTAFGCSGIGDTSFTGAGADATAAASGALAPVLLPVLLEKLRNKVSFDLAGGAVVPSASALSYAWLANLP